VKQKKLIEGRTMSCPRCKVKQDILSFTPLDQIEEYAHETAPIYKCSLCRWVFAPVSRDILSE
jgi:rubredoxin